jgi:hypothetical protein
MAGVYFSDLFRFDPSSLVWTNLTAAARGPRPSARLLAGFAALGDTLYLLGGAAAVGPAPRPPPPAPAAPPALRARAMP